MTTGCRRELAVAGLLFVLNACFSSCNISCTQRTYQSSGADQKVLRSSHSGDTHPLYALNWGGIPSVSAACWRISSNGCVSSLFPDCEGVGSPQVSYFLFSHRSFVRSVTHSRPPPREAGPPDRRCTTRNRGGALLDISSLCARSFSSKALRASASLGSGRKMCWRRVRWAAHSDVWNWNQPQRS